MALGMANSAVCRHRAATNPYSHPRQIRTGRAALVAYGNGVRWHGRTSGPDQAVPQYFYEKFSLAWTGRFGVGHGCFDVQMSLKSSPTPRSFRRGLCIYIEWLRDAATSYHGSVFKKWRYSRAIHERSVCLPSGGAAAQITGLCRSIRGGTHLARLLQAGEW
jgi:hypothetical protein